jgi:putative FmdB family regulatory protein
LIPAVRLADGHAPVQQEVEMPFYSFRCLDCKKKFDIFLAYSDYGTQPVVCIACQSLNVQRRINRVRIARSDDSRLDDLGGMDDIDGMEDDPRALGKMMRKMSQEMGEDMAPELGEVIDRLEAGQSPDDIEASMPDLDGSDGDSGGAGFAGDED